MVLSQIFPVFVCISNSQKQAMTSHIMTLPRVRGSGQLILSLLWMVSERHQFVASQPPIKLTKRKMKVFSTVNAGPRLCSSFEFWSTGLLYSTPLA